MDRGDKLELEKGLIEEDIERLVKRQMREAVWTRADCPLETQNFGISIIFKNALRGYDVIEKKRR